MISTVPSSIVQEMHKLASDGALIYLLEIPEHNIRLARNTQDIRWGGKNWTKSWFEIESLNESASELPDIWVTTSNIGGLIEQEILAHDNFEDSTCTITIINSNYLGSSANYLYSITFDIMKVRCTRKIAAIKLSLENPLLLSFPAWKFHASLCPYNPFPDDPRCKYTGDDTECARTLKACWLKGNNENFGGFPNLIGEFVNLKD